MVWYKARLTRNVRRGYCVTTPVYVARDDSGAWVVFNGARKFGCLRLNTSEAAELVQTIRQNGQPVKAAEQDLIRSQYTQMQPWM
jgi:hypothetical protein